MEDEYDISLKNKYTCLLDHKKYLLPISIFLPCMLINTIFLNYIYIFFSSFISILILTYNFPYLSKLAYLKPIYFNDLDTDNPNNKITKKRILYNMGISNKFKKKFIILQQFFFSITLSLIFDYIKYKEEDNEYNVVEFIAFFGGLVSIHTKLILILGRIILNYLYYKKEKEKQKLLNIIHTQNQIIIS
jgi:hypothetical protein